MFNFKRTAACILSLSMLLPTVPATVQAEGENTWKFDFGYSDSVEEGYIAVTPNMSYTSNTVDGLQFGFLGITEDSYSESGKWDGYSVVKGQKINLKAGGEKNTAADSDYIAVPSSAEYLPEGASAYEGRYPIRFAMKVTPKTYYTVKATVANSSSTENAVISLQSEKRHIIDNNIVLTPGQTKEYTFSVDVEDYRYKSESAAYEDDMLNIIVAGKNAALSSLEITKHAQTSGKINGTDATVNNGVTLWCCDDSTGCDQVGAVPYFELQNYAGVCQELSKYVPDSIAVSNQGEGGLATNDTAHLVQCYLKEGDYLYVQYGHNENSAADYKSNLEKYYTKAHVAGAKLIVVSPVERHNNWDSDNKKYTSGFTSYIEAGKSFVDDKITNSGATDIAFVDLNTEYIEWMNTEIARINSINPNISKQDAIEFYYRSVKGSKVDTTHINDAGADQGAIAFFKAAQKVYNAGISAENGSNAKIQSDVLAELVTNWHSERTAYTVSDEIINEGKAPNSYWDTPVTNFVPYKYDIAVTDAQTEISEENGKILKSVTLRVQNDLNSYAKAVVTVTSGEETKKYYSTGVVDNTADGKGTLKTFTEFSTTNGKNAETLTVTIPDGAICTVQAYEADLDDWTVHNDAPYSIAYTVKNITGTVLTEDCTDISDWTKGGSATNSIIAVTDAENGDAPYMNVTKSGSGSSAFKKTLDTNITGGIANVKLKMRYNSGYVRMSIANATNSSATYFMNLIDALTINDGKITINNTQINTNTSDTPNIVNAGDWFDIDCIIDYDNGIASISVAGSDYVTVDVSGLQTNTTSMLPVTCFGFETPDSKSDKGYDCDIKDISITKIERNDELPTKMVSAAVNDSKMGVVTINGEAVSSADITRGNTVIFKAVPNEGYEFVNWTDADGALLSTTSAYIISKLYEGVSVTANFKSSYGEGYTVQKIDEFTDDFEGETNIFGITEKSTYKNDSGTETTSILTNPSIVPTGNLSTSVFGNVLGLGRNAMTLTSSLSDDNKITMNDRQTLTMTMDLFTSQFTNSSKNQVIYTMGIYDDSDKEIAAFDYYDLNGKINGVRINGTSVDGFSEFNFYKTNNGFNAFDFTSTSYPYKAVFEISGNGNVKLILGSNEYSGKISETIIIKSLKITRASNESDYVSYRSSGIDNIKTLLVTAPETQKLTVTATDIKTNEGLSPTITLTDSNDNKVEDFTKLYGTYTYKAELDGYHSAEGKVTVYDNDKTLNIEMIPNTFSAVRSVDEMGNVLKTTVADSESDTVVYYPAIIQSGDKYYKTTANTTAQDDGNKYSYGKYFASAAISDITYTEFENCVYYAEAETAITDGEAVDGTEFSNGKAKIAAEFETDVLPAGTYSVYVAGKNISSEGNASVYVNPHGGKNDNNKRAVVYKSQYGGGTVKQTISTEQCFDIKYANPERLQLDYIYIMKLPNEYTVTYNKDGGTIENESNYTSYTYGVGLTLPLPTKSGYTFDGWYDGETKVTEISTTDTGDKTFTAHWTSNEQPPTTYTVIITGGEGIDNVKLGTKDGTKSGNTYTFTDVEAGEYIFDVTYTTGYEKAADSPSGITVSAGKQTETISAQKKKYTVTFKIEGQEDTTIQVEHGSTAERQAPQSPTKEGYHFVGWVKGTDTTQGVVTTWDEITANGTIYTAKFEENAPDAVTVTFSAGEGGTLTGNVSKTITKGGSLAFADIPTASKTGYDFIGWNDGTTTYTVTELLDKDINENTTLTAQYTIKQFTVTFDTDGGDAIDAVTQNYNTTITLPTPTREGYTFVKWNDGMTDYNAGDSYTITGDVTLTASWTQNVQPPIYLDVLDAFADKLTIEKITDDAGVILVITPINGDALPMLKMYSAVYCADGTLASVTLQEITVGTDGKVTITLANPNLTPTGLNFKFFLWNDKMEPIIDTIAEGFFE